MNATHGLNERTVAQIVGVFERFPSVETATLFGSRAKGVHKPGSDIDLAIAGDVDWQTIGTIEDALDDLLLPYKFSLVIHNESTDADVAAHIRRVGCLFYSKAKEVEPLKR